MIKQAFVVAHLSPKNSGGVGCSETPNNKGNYILYMYL